MTSTIKPEEVATFDDWSEKWWDLDGPCCLLHSMNSIRVPLVAEKVKGIQNPRILDVGSGAGILSEALAKFLPSAKIIGLDPVESCIKVANAHLPSDLKNNVTYMCGTLEEVVISEKFDVVVLSEVLDHVSNPELFVKLAVPFLKMNGTIIVTAPAKTAIAWLSVQLITERILRKVPVGTHHYSNFVAQSDVEKMLVENGCGEFDIRGMWYNPLLGSWAFRDFAKYFMYAISAKRVQTLNSKMT